MNVILTFLDLLVTQQDIQTQYLYKNVLVSPLFRHSQFRVLSCCQPLYFWPGEPLLLTCQPGVLGEEYNAGGYTWHHPQRPQEVRRTCFLGRRKIPMGGNGRDSRLTTIRKREHANIFLGWGSNHCFTIFQFGFLWPMSWSLLKQRNVPFSSFRCCQKAMASFSFFFFVIHR